MSAHRPIDPAAAAPLDAAAVDANTAAAMAAAAPHLAKAPDLAEALAAAPFVPSRKTEGWTASRQRRFLEFVALGHSVETAARTVELSPQSAYAFRASARGAVFALGWRAALVLARDRLADTLLARAFDGQTVTVTRADGSQVERHYHDNRLALATLTRLDRLADAEPAPGAGSAPVPACAEAARLAAQDWDGFLDLVEEERGPARAALFLARRSGTAVKASGAAPTLEPIAALARADLRLRAGVGHPDEIDTADLDPARRGDWTAAQWARAEAAGLLQLAPPPPPPPPAPNPQPPQHSTPAPDEDADTGSVWWDEDLEEWRTDYPPRPGFDGWETREYGDDFYERALDDEEEEVLAARAALALADRVAAASAARDAWLAAERAVLAKCLAARGEGGGAEPGDAPAVAGVLSSTP